MFLINIKIDLKSVIKKKDYILILVKLRIYTYSLGIIIYYNHILVSTPSQILCISFTT